MGENNPCYLDSAPLNAHCDVYQGAKPHIYTDSKDNKKPRVYESDEEDYNWSCSLLSQWYPSYCEQLRLAPINLIPDLNADDGNFST